VYRCSNVRQLVVPLLSRYAIHQDVVVVDRALNNPTVNVASAPKRSGCNVAAVIAGMVFCI
jgi:predicted choloylglycine hydrolase